MGGGGTVLADTCYNLLRRLVSIFLDGEGDDSHPQFDRRGGLGGHECDPSQTKRAGVHYLAHSQQGEQRGYFGGLFGY